MLWWKFNYNVKSVTFNLWLCFSLNAIWEALK